MKKAIVFSLLSLSMGSVLATPTTSTLMLSGKISAPVCTFQLNGTAAPAVSPTITFAPIGHTELDQGVATTTFANRAQSSSLAMTCTSPANVTITVEDQYADDNSLFITASAFALYDPTNNTPVGYFVMNTTAANGNIATITTVDGNNVAGTDGLYRVPVGNPNGITDQNAFFWDSTMTAIAGGTYTSRVGPANRSYKSFVIPFTITPSIIGLQSLSNIYPNGALGEINYVGNVNFVLTYI